MRSASTRASTGCVVSSDEWQEAAFQNHILMLEHLNCQLHFLLAVVATTCRLIRGFHRDGLLASYLLLQPSAKDYHYPGIELDASTQSALTPARLYLMSCSCTTCSHLLSSPGQASHCSAPRQRTSCTTTHSHLPLLQGAYRGVQLPDQYWGGSDMKD
jgi:hypothetical protein